MHNSAMLLNSISRLQTSAHLAALLARRLHHGARSTTHREHRHIIPLGLQRILSGTRQTVPSSSTGTTPDSRIQTALKDAAVQGER